MVIMGIVLFLMETIMVVITWILMVRDGKMPKTHNKKDFSNGFTGKSTGNIGICVMVSIVCFSRDDE